MIERRKKLCNIKSNNTSITLLKPASLNEISEVDTSVSYRLLSNAPVTNFIWSYLRQFFDDSHGLKASLKLLRRPFDRCQSRLEAINNCRDIKQINW